MKRHPAWGGSPPKSSYEGRLRILVAARKLAIREGVGAVTIARISQVVGVTRPTVYQHFSRREALLREAFMRDAAGFRMRVGEVIDKAPDPPTALVEAIAFVAERLPQEPLLSLALKGSELSEFGPQSLSDTLALENVAQGLEPIFCQQPSWQAERLELAELFTRVCTSLVIFPTPRNEDPEALRAFVRRRLLPMFFLGPAALHIEPICKAGDNAAKASLR